MKNTDKKVCGLSHEQVDNMAICMERMAKESKEKKQSEAHNNPKPCNLENDKDHSD